MKRLIPIAVILLLTGLKDARSDTLTFNFDSGVGRDFTVFNAHGDTGETVYAQPGGLFNVATQGPNLRMSKTADNGTFETDGNLGAGVRSTFKLVGDFSVTVDFALSDFPPTSQDQGLNAAWLTVFTADDQVVSIGRYRWSTRDFIELYGSNGISSTGSCTLTNGCLRLQRIGNTITGLYAINEESQFTTVFSNSGYSGPLGIELAAIQGRNQFYSPRSTSSMDISFDNLVIQADAIVSVPEPSAMMILLSGVIALSLFVWRRCR